MFRRLFFSLFFSFSVILLSAQSIFPPSEISDVYSAEGERAGYSVAVYGDYAVVGVPGYQNSQGKAFVMKYENGTWSKVADLYAENPQDGAKFGFSVAIYDNYIMVGAPYYDIDVENQGAVFVFYSSDGTWAGDLSSDKFLTDEDPNEDENYGFSLDMTTILAVGAPGKSGKGGVFVGELNGTSWQNVALLTFSEGETGDSLGYSVGLYQDAKIITGAPNAGSTGLAFIYQIHGSWDSTGNPDAVLVGGQSHFGVSVALGDFAVVGDDKSDLSGTAEGGVYVFECQGGTWSGEIEPSFTLQAKGINTDGSLRFGASVDIQNQNILVGAPGDNAGQGTVFGFMPPYVKENTPTFIFKPDKPDANFGTSLAFGQKQIVVGGPGVDNYTGLQYLFLGPYVLDTLVDYKDVCGNDTVFFNPRTLLVKEFQWFSKKYSQSEFQQLADDDTFSGVTTGVLTVNLDSTLDSSLYFCNLSNYYTNTLHTDTGLVTLEKVEPIIKINNTYHQYYLNANGQARLNVSDYATVADECGIADSVFILATTAQPGYYGTCDDLNHNRQMMLLVRDVSGNTATYATLVYTVADTLAPSFDVGETEVYLDENGQGQLNPDEIIHNVHDNCGVTDTIISKPEFNCGDVGDDTISVTLTDLSGNSITKKTVIHVNDYIWPDLQVKQDTVTLYLDSNGTVLPKAAIISATDNCPNLDTIMDTLNCMALNKVLQDTITVRDIMGNEIQKVVKVRVKDTIKPAMFLHHINVYLDSTGVAMIKPYMFIDYLWDNCSIVDTFFEANQTSLTTYCSFVGNTFLGYLTAVDDAGNSVVKQYEYTVYDTLTPKISNCPADKTVDVDSSGYYVVPDESLDIEVCDNCGIDTVFNSVNDSSTLQGHIFAPGTYHVTWTAKDKNGNLATCSFELTVKGQAAYVPEISDKNVIVYPNPASGKLFIALPLAKKGQLYIIDQTGRVVVRKTFNTNTLQFDVSYLPAGVYTIGLKLEGNLILKKFVKY